LLTAEQVGHHELDLAGPGHDRQILQGEGARRHRAGVALDIVDEHVDDRVLPGEAADGGQRKGHEARIGAEVGGILNARHADGCRERAGGRDRIAEPQSGAAAEKVARQGGVQAHDVRSRGEVGQQEARRARAPTMKAAEFQEPAQPVT
jgi:hypothetical protein